MATEVNTKFLERVAEFIDEHDGMSHIPKHAEFLLERQDYEALEAYMNRVEAELSQEHFHNYNQLEATDVY